MASNSSAAGATIPRPETSPEIDLPAPSRSERSYLNHILIALAIAYVAASILTNAIISSQTWLVPDQAAPGKTAVTTIGVTAIIPAVASVHSLSGTLTWWTHPWAGPFRYWRPLTSLGFWLQYRAFGVDHFASWQVVMILSHLV